MSMVPGRLRQVNDWLILRALRIQDVCQRDYADTMVLLCVPTELNAQIIVET